MVKKDEKIAPVSLHEYILEAVKETNDNDRDRVVIQSFRKSTKKFMMKHLSNYAVFCLF